jgi:hypothetical protein
VQTAAASHPTGRRESFFEKHATVVAAALTVLGLGALVTWQLVTAGAAPDDWDYLFCSGSLVTLGGLWLARGQPERFASMLDRLANRRALRADPELTPEAAAELRDQLDDRARRWSSRGGLLAGSAILVIWSAVGTTRDQDIRLFDELAGPVVGALGGYLVGRVLGRMVSYGLLGHFLARRRVRFGVTPWHVDGAGGLKPLGDYYLYQALLVALPAVFLLVWSLLFLLPDFATRYDSWRETYLALLGLAIVIEIVAFVAPMWHAHVAMKEAKRDALVVADTELARDIDAVRTQLEGDLSSDDRSAAQDRLARLTARYDAIETMTTWPIDRALRRRVTLGNAALVLGLVAQAAALAGS